MVGTQVAPSDLCGLSAVYDCCLLGALRANLRPVDAAVESGLACLPPLCGVLTLRTQQQGTTRVCGACAQAKKRRTRACPCAQGCTDRALRAGHKGLLALAMIGLGLCVYVALAGQLGYLFTFLVMSGQRYSSNGVTTKCVCSLRSSSVYFTPAGRQKTQQHNELASHCVGPQKSLKGQKSLCSAPRGTAALLTELRALCAPQSHA